MGCGGTAADLLWGFSTAGNATCDTARTRGGGCGLNGLEEEEKIVRNGIREQLFSTARCALRSPQRADSHRISARPVQVLQKKKIA